MNKLDINKKDIDQTDTDETGTHKTGMNKTGADETGMNESSTQETDTQETGTQKAGTQETGVNKTDMHEMNMADLTIKEGFAEMDFEKVTSMLAAAHWTPGVSRAEVERAAAHSALVVGVFTPEGRQLGYARAVSDMTRFAYLMDVIVEDEKRDLGIGEMMIEYILHHEEMTGVYQWMLLTTRAHDFYRKCGFEPTTRPGDLMEIRKPRPR